MNYTITKDNILLGADVEFVEDVTLGEVVVTILRAHADKILQINPETGEKLTAQLALTKSICLAKWMLSSGMKPGDVVTINSENRIDFCIIPLAAFLIGVTFAPLNPDYTPGELSHVLNLSKPKFAFCSAKTYETMKNIMANHRHLEKLIIFDDIPTRKGDLLYKDIMKGMNESDNDEYEPIHVNPNESIATILCSSGTTGLPKGVMTTHANMTNHIDILRAIVEDVSEKYAGGIITLGIAPFFHSMGFMSMFLHILGGNTLVVMKQFKIKTFFESISKYKVNTLAAPPPILLVLLKHPSVSSYDMSSLTDIRSGAAPMGKDIELELSKKFNLKHTSQGYGLTETTLGVLMSRFSSTKAGSCGQLVPGMMCKVIDDTGKAVKAYVEGEVCFKGPLIMKGYIGDPVATKNTIDPEGWLHTGDIAYYDEEGFFFIVDRIKELIKYKAFQVAPAELEALLLTHPSIADAAVIGLPDLEAGELPLAFVVKKPGVLVTEKEIQDFVAGKVSRQKQLRGGVQFIEEIPRVSSGKILRRELKQRAIKLKSKL